MFLFLLLFVKKVFLEILEYWRPPHRQVINKRKSKYKFDLPVGLFVCILYNQNEGTD